MKFYTLLSSHERKDLSPFFNNNNNVFKKRGLRPSFHVEDRTTTSCWVFSRHDETKKLSRKLDHLSTLSFSAYLLCQDIPRENLCSKGQHNPCDSVCRIASLSGGYHKLLSGLERSWEMLEGKSYSTLLNISINQCVWLFLHPTFFLYCRKT